METTTLSQLLHAVATLVDSPERAPEVGRRLQELGARLERQGVAEPSGAPTSGNGPVAATPRGTSQQETLAGGTLGSKESGAVGDRTLTAPNGRKLPVRVSANEPIEFVGVSCGGEGDDCELMVELHNPSQNSYAVHVDVLLKDDDGRTLDKKDILFRDIDASATQIQRSAVRIPAEADRVDILAKCMLSQ